MYDTGDPSYSITSGIVHLSGSMWRPAGSPIGVPFGEDSAVLPAQAQPADSCFDALTYTYGGSMWNIGIQQGSGDVFNAVNNKYISWAGVSYPPSPAAWQSLPLVNGSTDNFCAYGAAYEISGNVVYLTGFMNTAWGFNGEIAVLPPAARPSHYVYMIAYTDNATSNEYVTLRIGPDGAMYIFGPSGGKTGLLTSLSGLSFHLLS